MMVKNATNKKKAVRIAGGFQVILPGKSAEVSADWDDVEIAKYRKAGLEFSEGKADRTDEIAAMIEGLDREKDFTAGGKPEVDAINALLDEGADPVTAKERDAVWASMAKE